MKIKVGQLKRIIREEAARLAENADLVVGDNAKYTSEFSGNEVCGAVKKIEGGFVWIATTSEGSGLGRKVDREDVSECTPEERAAYDAKVSAAETEVEKMHTAARTAKWAGRMG